MLVIKVGIHKMLVRIANREDPGQTASSNLIRVCTVCLGTFSRQLVFGIIEHLPYKVCAWQVGSYERIKFIIAFFGSNHFCKTTFVSE